MAVLPPPPPPPQRRPGRFVSSTGNQAQTLQITRGTLAPGSLPGRDKAHACRKGVPPNVLDRWLGGVAILHPLNNVSSSMPVMHWYVAAGFYSCVGSFFDPDQLWYECRCKAFFRVGCPRYLARRPKISSSH